MAWSPDGRRVAVAAFTPEDAFGYNGDPDRLGDRTLVNYFSRGRLALDWRCDRFRVAGGAAGRRASRAQRRGVRSGMGAHGAALLRSR